MKTSISINTNNKNNEFKYLYKLEKGISNIKGGIKILSDMNYPEEILENTRKFSILEQ
jgi:DNA mismatch repair ATPase MutS